MNVPHYIALMGVMIANILCEYFMINDDKLNTSDNKQEAFVSKKSLFVFAIVGTFITMGIAVFLFVFYQDNTILYSLKRILMLVLLWPISLIDMRSYRIPNKFIILGLSFRVIVFVLECFFENGDVLGNLLSEIIAVIALTIAAFLCSICMRGSIGYGDIKLFIVMGFLLGTDGIWGAIFMSLIIAFFSSLFLLITKKKGRKDVIPFAPSIAIGTFISVILTGM